MTTAQKQLLGLAVASLVLGILGLILLGPLGSIPAVVCGHLAKSQIKRNPETLAGDGMALAGLILGYVQIGFMIVAMIFMLAAIAIPSFLCARENSRRNGCINNLRQIDAAKQSCALENGIRDGYPVVEGGDDTAAFVAFCGVSTGYLKEFPFCPSADPARERTAANSATDYTVGVIGANPLCNIMGDDEDFPHALPSVENFTEFDSEDVDLDSDD